MKHRPDQELTENKERFLMDVKNFWRNNIFLLLAEEHSMLCEK